MFHELLVAWRSFSVGETTWEPYSVMAVDDLACLRSSWSLTAIQTWCARCDIFESSHGEVLCDATNETSVSDMQCRDNKEVCKYCMNITVLRTLGDPRRKQSHANLLTVLNLLVDIIWSSSRTPSFLAIPLGLDLSCIILNSVG
jgi:hypothetical protein